MKEYFQKNATELVGTNRFKEIYMPEIYELVNDEESYVQIEAIEGITEVLDKLDAQKLEEEFIPNLLRVLIIANNHDDIVIRVAKIVGRIAYKLSPYDLHMKYKK